MDTRLATAIRKTVHRVRNPRKLNVTPAGSWGGLSASFDTYRRERIPSFAEHSVYLLGILCNPEEETLVAVLSSENLLLNAHRQQFWGLPMFFACDASYCLTLEKIGVYPVVTTNLGMETNTIAYGVISHEHHNAQRFILSTIKNERESIVKRRRAAGNTEV